MIALVFLAEWAVRSSMLIASGALLLLVLRVKAPSLRLAAWIAMLCASLAIPALTAALPKMQFAVKRAEAPAIDEDAPTPTSAVSLPKTGAQAPKPFRWSRAALILYLLVVLTMLLRLSVGLALSLRWLRTSRATGHTEGRIEIRESDRVSAPVTVGVLRPVILRPGDWSAWDQTKLDAVLAHERSHIERSDPAVQLLSAIHRALLWHSPLSWVLHRNIVRLAEEASDDAAIAATGNRASYAEILLDFLRRGVRGWGVAGVPMARYGGAERRIGRILSGTVLPRNVTRWSLAAIVALVSPIAYVVAAAHPANAPQEPPAAPVQMVQAAPATVHDAMYLDALGAVSATTVTIKPRIDGQLLSVSFKEGEQIQPGQLIASIDPQPYEIQLAQAEAQLARDSNGPNVPADQANVDRAKLQLSYTQIRSPISGVAGFRQVDPGNLVYAAADATPIVVITQLRPIAVVFDVPEDTLPQLQTRIREGVSLTAEAWNRDLTRKIATGYLTAIDNQIDVKTGTVKLKAEFNNKDGALFPHEFVNVRLAMTR